MRGQRIQLIVLAMCVIGAVSRVSGFAQSNTSSHVSGVINRPTVLALREYVADAALPDGSTDVPTNVVASPGYQELMRSMLERSPTFRRQCLRIATTPDLLITVERRAAAWSASRAQTRISRERGGRVHATIEVSDGADQAELIAHEFEHIIEQLDGVDLPSRARLASTGVSRGSLDSNTFETVRARRVGATVLAELRAGGL